MDETQHRSFAILWNGSSGWGDSSSERELVADTLSSRGSRVHVRQVRQGMNIFDESKAMAAGGADVLVAAGGDGTINAAASAIIHGTTALGVIPAGTLNHFARDLDLPIHPAKAAQALLDGQYRQIDVASVNDRIFINNAVLGLFPNYRKAREFWERHGFGTTRFGRLFATLASLWSVFWRLPHLQLSFRVTGQERRIRTPFVLLGNNEHRMAGLSLGKRSRLDSGLLWVYALRPCTRWQLLRLMLKVLWGSAPRESIFETFSTSELTIESRRKRLGVGIDGEMVRMRAPLHFKSLPGALRVLAPPSQAIAAAENKA